MGSLEKQAPLSVSVKFPYVKKEGKDQLSGDEFEELFALSGETSKSTFIHKALRHYVDEVYRQLKEKETELANRVNKLEKLFHSK